MRFFNEYINNKRGDLEHQRNLKDLDHIAFFYSFMIMKIYPGLMSKASVKIILYVIKKVLTAMRNAAE